ncbi:MAG: ECF transporter S component, partial [Erysipelotrichaceae bacterium]|nr:ECF transporter S component [Erysipelotrichaceae bacterium]
TRTIVSIAVLGALAGVLMFIKFPIPIAPSFYKLEFSDTAALIGGFAMGPLAAVLICFIKNLINVILEGTTTAFVGEISNFIMSCALCATAAFIYKKEHTKKGAIKAMAISVIVLAVVSAIINYAVVIPAYVRFMGFPLEAIIGMGAKIFPIIDSLFKLVLLCTVPFNLIKGIAVSLITFVLYKRISPLINGKSEQ